jgi:hypothetical protein
MRFKSESCHPEIVCNQVVGQTIGLCRLSSSPALAMHEQPVSTRSKAPRDARCLRVKARFSEPRQTTKGDGLSHDTIAE